MRENQLNNLKLRQRGFTLMEIIVATAIFAIVIASTLALFNSVLKINRQVQAIRQVAQASRNFTEVLSREIRNGRIDYTSATCPVQYTSNSNQALALISYTGEKLCFFLDTSGGTNILKLQRSNTYGTSTENIVPTNISINVNSFRFLVRPSNAWNGVGGNRGIQPMVTILAEFQINKGQANQKIIPYQSSISTDVYDIPNTHD